MKKIILFTLCTWALTVFANVNGTITSIKDSDGNDMDNTNIKKGEVYTIAKESPRDASITFHNSAQKSGKITLKITYEDGTVDLIVTANIPVGTEPFNKCYHLSECIKAMGTQGVWPDCTHIQDPKNKGIAVLGLVQGSNKIAKLEFSDDTNQKVTINPGKLNPPEAPKNVGIKFIGTGSCISGEVSLILDSLDLSAIIPSYGKTGNQISNELVYWFNDLYQNNDITFTSIDLGEHAGKLLIQNLPAGQSEFTLDVGGDCGLSSTISVTTLSFVIPTLSEWGVIILILLLLAVGMVFIYKRQTALAMAGGVEEAGSRRFLLFNKQLYAKVFGFTLIAGLAFLGLTYLIIGEITSADPFGTFVSAAIIAYMIHFMILRRNQ